MGPKPKKDENASKPKGKTAEKKKNQAVVPDPPPPPPATLPIQTFRSPFPLVTSLENPKLLAKGEHQFISIVTEQPPPPPLLHELSNDPNPIAVEEDDDLQEALDQSSNQQSQRIQKIKNLLDGPFVPPPPIQHYDGPSFDCYCRTGLDLLPELCENCKEIWRRWPIRPPPPDIDPFENFLCVGDIDPHFEPARGDVAIFHPYGPQSVAGLRTGWGFVASYKGPGELKFHPNDLVVRLSTFSKLYDGVVDYIPYDKVELRVMTQSLEWRFLGGQVGLVSKAAAVIQPAPSGEAIAVDEKDGRKGGKKGKSSKEKDGKKLKSAAAAEEDGNKKNEKKAGKPKEVKEDKKAQSAKKDKKGAKKKGEKDDKELQVNNNDAQFSDLPEFTLDGIPDVFNTIPKLPDVFIPHPGERALKSRPPSLTCNYRYSNPGMKCGMGELEPQFGDVIIREPQSWLHDDWGDRRKRPKGSIIKWYKPAPWKRDLKLGMILLRPYIDRDVRLDGISGPRCPCTPILSSHWGHLESYVFQGPDEVVAPPPKKGDEIHDEDVDSDLGSDSKGGNNNKLNDLKKGKGKDGMKASAADGKKAVKGKKESDDKKGGKDNIVGGNKKNAGKESGRNSLKEELQKMAGETDQVSSNNENSGKKRMWTYWGRSCHVFDTPFQAGSLDEFCAERHQAEATRAVHLDFFVEDSGAGSDLEQAAKSAQSIIPAVKEEPKGKKQGKKGAAAVDKSKTKKGEPAAKKK